MILFDKEKFVHSAHFFEHLSNFVLTTIVENHFFGFVLSTIAENHFFMIRIHCDLKIPFFKSYACRSSAGYFRKIVV